MFRVNRTTVTRWANDGKLTTIRTLGGHRRYRSTEIRDLLAGIPVRQPEPGGEIHQGSTVTTATAALSRPRQRGYPAAPAAPTAPGFRRWIPAPQARTQASAVAQFNPQDPAHLVHRRKSMTSTADITSIRFLTVSEVALMMRVSKMTVYRLVHAGELEAIRVGRSFRVPELAVTQYLQAAFVTPAG